MTGLAIGAFIVALMLAGAAYLAIRRAADVAAKNIEEDLK